MLKKAIWQNVITIGAGLGIVRFGINLVAAEMEGPEILFESVPLAILAMALTIIAMIWSGYRAREANGNLIDLQSGFLTMFGVYAIAGLISAICNSIYLELIRPEFLPMVADWADRLSTNGKIREYLSSLIFGALMAMAFAFGLKREKVKVVAK